MKLFCSVRTCLCSLERNTRVDSCVAPRWSPLLIRVRWPFLEHDHAWLFASMSRLRIPAWMMQGLSWTPSYCSPGEVRHSPVSWLLKAELSASQCHSSEVEYEVQSAKDTLPPCAWRHFPSSLFWILKADTTGEETQHGLMELEYRQSDIGKCYGACEMLGCSIII